MIVKWKGEGSCEHARGDVDMWLAAAKSASHLNAERQEDSISSSVSRRKPKSKVVLELPGEYPWSRLLCEVNGARKVMEDNPDLDERSREQGMLSDTCP